MRIGILGGGQLGRMLALAGIPLGHQFRFLDPDPKASAQAVGELFRGDFDDRELLQRFANGVDVITYEFENVPVESAEFLAQFVPVFPPPAALKVSQDRLVEKQFAQRLGIATPRFAAIQSLEELRSVAASWGFPIVLKTRRFGYDGRGQWVIRQPSDWDMASKVLSGSTAAIVEEFVPFDRELSIIAARSRDALIRNYCLVENVHEGGILRRSQAPASRVSSAVQAQAEGAARRTLGELNYVGVLALEFFEVDGRLLFNEMAPRVHNSGHWTIEGAVTSQFENHIRAVVGWPLGDPSCRGMSVMFNLIGTVPDPRPVLEVPGVHWHLYGKEPRPGRKLGHVTLCGENPDELAARTAQFRDYLAGCSGLGPT